MAFDLIFTSPLFYLVLFLPYFLTFVVVLYCVWQLEGNKSNRRRRREEDQDKALIASRRLNKIILSSLDFEDVVQKIADSIPNELYFGTGVVSIIDEERQVIRRIAASQTKEAQEAIKALSNHGVPFKNIEIPLSDDRNYMVKAIREHKILITDKTIDVMVPILNESDAQTLQNIMGVKTTFVCPIYGSSNKAIGVFIASTKKRGEDLTQYENDMIEIFIDGVGIAIEHAILYSRLHDTSNQLEQANIKLQQLDKLKDDFVSLASHELRTPMTAIKSYLWMALNKKKQEIGPDLTRYLNNAYISTDRLISLVNDMLNVSRIEEGRISLILRPTDLGKLLEFVVEEVTPKAQEKQVTVSVEKSDMPQVMCDEDKIHEVLLNLIGNSLKFTKTGGKITISFKVEDPFVTITVADNGVGIAQEDLPRLFSKFGRLANSYVAMAESSGGTGLGLYITKALVELHKGKINATSDGLGKGAQFAFTLPIVDSSVAQQLLKDTPPPTDDAKQLEHTTIRI